MRLISWTLQSGSEQDGLVQSLTAMDVHIRRYQQDIHMYSTLMCKKNLLLSVHRSTYYACT